MAIRLTCPCGKRFLVADDLAEQRAPCPACRSVLSVPPVGIQDYVAAFSVPAVPLAEEPAPIAPEPAVIPVRTRTAVAGTPEPPALRTRHLWIIGCAGLLVVVSLFILALAAVQQLRQLALADNASQQEPTPLPPVAAAEPEPLPEAPKPVQIPPPPKPEKPAKPAVQVPERVPPPAVPVREKLDRPVLVERDYPVGELSHFQVPTRGSCCVAFSADGLRLLAGGSDGLVELWEVETGRTVGRFWGFRAPVQCLAISPDGRLAVAGTGNDVARGSALVAAPDNTLRLWDLDTGKELRRLEGHQFQVKSAAFAPNGRQPLSCSSDGTVRLWNLDSGRPVRTFARFADSVAFAPTGRLALSVDGRGVFARDGTLFTITEDNEFAGTRGRLEIKPHGRGGRFFLWDLRDGDEVQDFKGHWKDVTRVAFAPDGLRVLSTGWDRTVRLWDVKTGRLLHTLEAHKELVQGIAFSPDGRRILSTGLDHTLRLWDAESGRQLHCFRLRSEPAFCVAFLADGRRAVTVGGDGIARVWGLPK